MGRCTRVGAALEFGRQYQERGRRVEGEKKTGSRNEEGEEMEQSAHDVVERVGFDGLRHRIGQRWRGTHEFALMRAPTCLLHTE